jgi:uncharacterized protein YndB with AHSA1/START domain
MLSPNSDQLIVLTGEYRVIQPPEKLVFTWGFESEEASAESLITLRFLARGAQISTCPSPRRSLARCGLKRP